MTLHETHLRVVTMTGVAAQAQLARGWFIGVAARGMDGAQVDEETHEDNNTNGDEQHHPPVSLKQDKVRQLQCMNLIDTVRNTCVRQSSDT